MYVTDVESVHALPTLTTGPACDTLATPFINDREYDAADELLSALYGRCNDRGDLSGELMTIVQAGFGDAEMLAEAFLYVPTSRAAGDACGIHVAIHGCTKSSEYVSHAFALGAGYNEWAESNNLLVLYPQVASSKVAPMNLYSCWDWWGYSSDDYATTDRRLK